MPNPWVPWYAAVRLMSTVRSCHPASRQYRGTSLAAVVIPVAAARGEQDPRRHRCPLREGVRESTTRGVARSGTSEHASSRSISTATAARISCLPCPTFAYHRPAVGSRYRFPSMSHSDTSSARSIPCSESRTEPMSARRCENDVSVLDTSSRLTQSKRPYRWDTCVREHLCSMDKRVVPPHSFVSVRLGDGHARGVERTCSNGRAGPAHKRNAQNARSARPTRQGGRLHARDGRPAAKRSCASRSALASSTSEASPSTRRPAGNVEHFTGVA